MQSSLLPPHHQWFKAARYGLFLHWGPYSPLGRGEQVLFRDHLDPREYETAACAWNPQGFDAREWAKLAVESGFRYAVLTARHHDGYCLWDSAQTDYSSAEQAPKRDFIAEYVEAFREAGLRVGIYYSILDWRIPAYWEGPKHDPAGWAKMRDYVHAQVEELLSNYGKIDVMWFDGVWPRNAQAWDTPRLVTRMRELQPEILINNRLDAIDPEEGEQDWQKGAVENAGDSKEMGDFGTPEQHIKAEKRPWEACLVSGWRLWGYTGGEHWKGADTLLDHLCETTAKGGNLLLNVGPDGEGVIPAPFANAAREVGKWLETHGEAIFDTQLNPHRGRYAGTDIVEFVTRGFQTARDNVLYCLFRFWDGSGEFRLAGIENRLLKAELLTTGETLPFEQSDDEILGRPILVRGLPKTSPSRLFPVLKLTFEGEVRPMELFQQRLWCGDPRRMTAWAKLRGDGFAAFNSNHE